MAFTAVPCLLVLALLVGKVWTAPAHLLDPESRPPLSELSARLAAHAQRETEPRLPLPSLPSPQEIEAIKKVAQILVMLGEQVIPAIIGEPPSGDPSEVPNDAVNDP